MIFAISLYLCNDLVNLIYFFFSISIHTKVVVIEFCLILKLCEVLWLPGAQYSLKKWIAGKEGETHEQNTAISESSSDIYYLRQDLLKRGSSLTVNVFKNQHNSLDRDSWQQYILGNDKTWTIVTLVVQYLHNYFKLLQYLSACRH